MTYICRWCENNFEEQRKREETEPRYRDGILCCPRCGNITYGFLVYKPEK